MPSVVQPEGIAGGDQKTVGRTRRPSQISDIGREVKKDEDKGGAGGAANTNAAMFADAGALKEQAHKNLDQPEYDVTNFYHDDGFAQYVARNHLFGNITLCMITINAAWIGLDTEFNDADNLTQAKWYFQLGEYTFTAFFLFEWLCRFGAFRNKRDGLRDRWFCFDSFLVALMMVETFVLPYAFPPVEQPTTTSVEATNSTQTSAGSGSNLSSLAMLRMLRLLRLTRMVRLMRAVPELVTLLRSMTIALRSVLSTLALLVIFMYIFAIIFKSQLKIDHDYKYRSYLITKFGRVPDAMWTLLLTGTFLDNISLVANRLLDQSPLLTVMFILFVMLSSFTILNLLVGLLCEVVDAVACAEKEKVMVSYVRSKLMGVLEKLDEDGNGTISRDEFDQLLQIPEAVQALEELGVDVQNLVSLSDHLFEVEEIDDADKEPSAAVGKQGSVKSLDMTEQDGERSDNSSFGDENKEPSEPEEVTMSNADFLEMVIRLRSTNQPSVLDIVDLRKLILKSQKNMMRRLESLEEVNQSLNAQIQVINDTIEYLSSKDCMAALVDWCSRSMHGPGAFEEHVRSQDLDKDVHHRRENPQESEGAWDVALENDGLYQPVAHRAEYDSGTGSSGASGQYMHRPHPQQQATTATAEALQQHEQAASAPQSGKSNPSSPLAHKQDEQDDGDSVGSAADNLLRTGARV